MKRMALIAFVCLLAGMAARGEEDFSNWFRVMTDSATPSSFWEMSSTDKSVISKKLVLPIPVNELKQAAFEYEIMVQPFDPKRKCHVTSKEYRWADLLLKVNGKEAFCGAAGPLILKGTHRIVFPVELLKEGENLFQLSWAPIKPEEKGKRVFGYIYVACDLTEEIRPLKNRKDRLAKAPETLRFRLLIR